MRIIGVVLFVSSCGLPASVEQTLTLPSNCQVIEAMAPEYLRCSGTFGKGEAAKLCPTGYGLVTTPMPDVLNLRCDLDAGLSAQGKFYAVDVGSWTAAPPFSSNSCSPMAGLSPSLRGCGGEENATEYAATDCKKWPHAIVCERSKGWTCPDGTLRTAANTNPDQGVVCLRL